MTTIDTTSVLPDSAQPVVFLGPTMPLADARRLLPRARFAPPVRCGDLLALLRLPSGPVSGALQVAIIDGCFENVAAVWHKEILWALRGGARIWGAASMGALRAAELCDLGMVGVMGDRKVARRFTLNHGLWGPAGPLLAPYRLPWTRVIPLITARPFSTTTPSAITQQEMV